MITSFFTRASKRGLATAEEEARPKRAAREPKSGAKPAMAAAEPASASASPDDADHAPAPEAAGSPAGGPAAAAAAGSAEEPDVEAAEPELPYGINVHPSWRKVVAAEARKPYFARLMAFVQQKRNSCRVFPPEERVFEALRLTPLSELRVVIVGQDPYHGPGQAHGLAFSVRPGVKIPPSLRNMYKELKTDCGIEPAAHGTLTSWARQGVLLLNTVLTVESGAAHSHKKRGWEEFTQAILAAAGKRPGVVFLLWGKPAQTAAKAASSRPGHHVLASPHPSPLSASRGFFGCRHFSKTNAFLRSRGQPEIRWQLPEDPSDD